MFLPFLKLKSVWKYSVLILIFIALSFLFFNSVLPVLATHTSSATISPEWTQGGISQEFTITVTNDGPDKIEWVRITKPPEYGDIIDCVAPLSWGVGVQTTYYCEFFTTSDYIHTGESREFGVELSVALDEGSYVWSVKTKDDQEEYYTTQIVSNVDNTSPTTTITPDGSDWVNYDVDFILECEDKQSDGVTDGSGCSQTYYKIIDSGATCPDVGDPSYTTGNSGTVTCDDGSDCEKKVCFYSIDMVGNVPTSPSESNTFRIDKKAPPTPTMYEESPYTQGTSNEVCWDSVTDEGSGGVQYYVEYDDDPNFGSPNGNSGWITETCYTFYGLLDATKYYYHVKAKDTVDNLGEWSNVVSSTQDDVQPSPKDPKPSPSSFTNNNTPTISIEVIDETSGVDKDSIVMKVNDQNVTPTITPITDGYKVEYTPTSPLDDGTVFVEIYASDNVGNPMNYDWNFIVDTRAPSVTVISPNGREIWAGGSTQEIKWDATDTNMTENPISIYYSYDGSEWIEIATNEENDGVYEWALPTIDSANVLVKVVAVDKAGNSGEDVSDNVFTIDSTKPTTIINSPAESSWQTADFDVGLTDNDDVGLFECKYRVLSYDGAEWIETKTWTTRVCSGSVTLTVGSDKDCGNEGMNTCKIEAYAIDEAGNQGDIETRVFSIDWTAPSVTLTAPLDGSYINTESYTVKADASDDASGIASVEFFYSLDEGANWISIGTDEEPPYEIEWDLSSIDDQKGIQVKAVATNNAGLTAEDVNTNITHDITPPTTISDLQTTSHPDAIGSWHIQSQDNSVDITWTAATDATSGLDGYSIICDTNPDTIPDEIKDIEETVTSYTCTFSDGTSNYFHIRAVDNAGNWGDAVHLGPFYIDTESPTITDDYEYDGIWVNVDQTVTLTPNDTTSGIKLVKYCEGVDCIPDIELSSPYQLSYTMDQDTIVRYQAWDNAENPSAIGEYNVKLDKTEPSASIIINNDATYTNNPQVTLTLTYSDALSGVKECRYSNDGSTWTDWEGCVTTKSWMLSEGDGTKTVYYEVKDNAGNVKQVSDTIFLDTKNPTTTDDYVEKDGVWQNSDQTITLTPSDPEPSSGVAWTKYCVDTENISTPDISYEEPIVISVEGIWYLRYHSADNAGNVQNIVSREVKIDKTPPSVSVTGAPQEWTNQDAQAGVECSDSLSGCDENSYRLYISDEELTECPTNYSQYTLVSPQTISSHVWVCGAAKDNAGNTGFSSPVEFKVDEDAPYFIEIVTDKTYYKDGDQITVLIEVSDKTSGVDKVYVDFSSIGGTLEECLLQDGNYLCESMVDQPLDGIYEILIVAKDLASNENQTSVSIYVDNTPPNITNITGNISVEVNQSILIEVNTTDEMSRVGEVILCYTGVEGDSTCIPMTKNEIFEAEIPPQPKSGVVSYNVTVIDNVGNSITSKNYYVKIYDLVISLVPGWNLISLPREAVVSDIDELFAEGDLLYYYNAATGEWMFSKVGEVEEFENLEALKGYWVYTENYEKIGIDYVKIDGNEIPLPSLELQLGWNLIGHTSIIPMLANESLISLVDVSCSLTQCTYTYSYAYVIGYEDGKMINIFTPGYNDPSLMYPGHGYWIYMKEPATLLGIE